LLDSVRRIEEARTLSEKNLAMARNTYKTVVLSSMLYDLVMQSKEEFMRVNRMQIPQIIPFKNLKMKRTYDEITKKLR
jgi:hypothetical protein